MSTQMRPKVEIENLRRRVDLLRENAIAKGHYLDAENNDCGQRLILSLDPSFKGHGPQMTINHCGLCYAVGGKRKI